MKTKEDLEKEYIDFKKTVPEIISSTSLATYLEFILDEMDHSRYTILRDKRSNYYAEKIVKAVDFITFKALNLDMDYFEKYQTILDSMFDLEVIITLYFNRIQNSITENNFQELFCLVRFIEKYHNEILGYYESERHVLEASQEGFTIENFSDNNLDVFKKFCNKKLDEYSPLKRVEKIKQM